MEIKNILRLLSLLFSIVLLVSVFKPSIIEPRTADVIFILSILMIGISEILERLDKLLEKFKDK